MEHTLESVIDVTVDNMQSVVETSNDKLVVMSFFSTQMPESIEMNTKLLEIAKKYQEHLVVAQVNCDEQPQMAQYFQIQTLPMLMLLQGGRMIDGIAGQQTKETLDEKLQKYLPALWQIKWQEAKECLTQQDFKQAAVLLRDAYALEPQPEIAIDWVTTLIQLQAFDEASVQLDQVESTLTEDQCLALRQQLQLALQSAETPQMKALQQAYAANPKDLKVVLAYAKELHGSGRQEQGLELLWDVIAQQNNALEGEVMREFQNLLATHAADDHGVKKFRRKLYGLLH